MFNKCYGKRRMYEKLQLDYDCPYSYNTVAKLMREHGLLHKPNHPRGLTKADRAARKSDNLLGRDFSASAPGQKTVTDITEWTALDGKIYQSSVFDCYDNMCLGISLADNMRAELCVETFLQASGRHDLRGAIAHSDRGSQYTSEHFRQTLLTLGILQSMNSAAGRCHDNAKCESMWARGKVEIMACYDTRKLTCAQLKRGKAGAGSVRSALLIRYIPPIGVGCTQCRIYLPRSPSYSATHCSPLNLRLTMLLGSSTPWAFGQINCAAWTLPRSKIH